MFCEVIKENEPYRYKLDGKWIQDYTRYLLVYTTDNYNEKHVISKIKLQKGMKAKTVAKQLDLILK